MAKGFFGVAAFKNDREFVTFMNHVQKLGRYKRRDVAAELGVCVETLRKMMANKNAVVREATRHTIERRLAEWSGIEVSNNLSLVKLPTKEQPKAKQSTAAGGDKLLSHLRDALLEAVSSCDNAAKLAAALNALLGGTAK